MRNSRSFFYFKTSLTVLSIIFSLRVGAANLYWIGGTGNWNDGSHWSTASGGPQSGLTPTSADNVFFDANSFMAPGQIVTYTSTANCLNMDWSGAANAPQLYTTNQDLNIFGSLTFTPGMTISINNIYFSSTSSGNTITTAGVNMTVGGAVYFDGVGGAWTLQDAFITTTDIIFRNGSLNTNGKAVACNTFGSQNTNNIRTLNLGSSTITIAGNSFDASQSNLLVTAGTSTIISTGINCNINGGPSALYDVSFTNNSTSGALYGTGTVHNFSHVGTGFIYHTGHVNKATAAYLGLDASLTLDTISLSAGSTLEVVASRTITVKAINSGGTCVSPLIITGGSSSAMTGSSPIVVDFARISNIAASGASFTANNSVDLGGNSGWTFTTPTTQNFFWIGGTGNWTDPTHWSPSSGGPSGTCIPTRYDNVHFDANSFSAGSQVVTINAVAECKTMDWTGATNSPTMNGTNDLSIYGSLTFISTMTNNLTGKVYFRSTGSGNTITMAGKSFNKEVHFDGAGADWTLNDDFTINTSTTTGYLYLDNGYIVTNDKTVNAATFYSTGNRIRGLYLMNSTINIANGANNTQWGISGSNFSVDAGTSTINLNGYASTFSGGSTSNVYYDVIMDDQISTIGSSVAGGGQYHNITFKANSYSNTYLSNIIINKLTFKKDADLSGNNNMTVDTLHLSKGHIYSTSASVTLNVNRLEANGSCDSMITLRTYGSATTLTFNSSNSLVANYLKLYYIAFTGSGSFTANSSIDCGANSGITINGSAGQNLYWVGGNGSWNDPNHWSLTSGGTGGACVPGPNDNVFFNASSFTAGSKTITMPSDPLGFFCKNMDWTGALFSPILTGTTNEYIRIYGSLTLVSGVNLTNYLGAIYFKATGSGNTITSAGRTWPGPLYFNGGGAWTLQDAFSTSNNLTLDAGTLNTNNKSVSCSAFTSTGSSNRTLTLGSSTVTVTGVGAPHSWEVFGSNFTVNPGSSLIKFTCTTGAANFNGGIGVNYNDLLFNDPVQDGKLVTGVYTTSAGNIRNVTFMGPGYTYYGTYKKLDFRKDSWNNGTVTTDSLLLSSGSLNTFTSNYKTTVNSYFRGDGTAGSETKLRPTSSGSYSISISACTVCANYMDINNCDAVGGANFYASNSINNGGNTGWNFASCPSSSLTVGPISGVTNTCNNTINTYSIPSLGGGATYTWTVPAGCTINSGQGTTSIQVTTTSAGTISVSASACGTSGAATKTITVNPIPSITSVSVTPSTCSHHDGFASAVVSGGTSPIKYQWSSGDTLFHADSLYSGQYQLNVSDVYGCSTSTLVTVNSSNGPVVSLSNSTNVSCNGLSTGSLTVSVTGGATPYSYAWTTGGTTNVANNLAAGSYVVTVTDNTGCQTVGNYSITQPPAMNIQFTVTPSSCASSTGSVVTNVTGGTGSYSYQWSANAASQTTANATALAAGIYSVVVTDANSCNKSASVIVTTNTSGASVSLDGITAGTCGSNGPGNISITTSGGASPYTYNWSNGSSTEDISGISPGTYSLGVIDANGCMTYTSFVVPNANPNYQPQICVVTFDTTSGSNLIVWEKTGAVGIQAYNIYCEIGSFNNYQIVGVVPAGSLSEFTHVGANPDVKSWKYKISAVDSCGNETPLSPYHKTIHLQISQGSGGAQNLSWDNYDGFNYGGFEVWRHTPTTNWVQLTSIAFCGFPVCTNTYTDFTPVPGDTNRYAILVTTPSPCVSTARLGNNGMQSTVVKSRSNVKNNRTGNGSIGVPEMNSASKFSVYPNPATTEITVSLNKECSNCVFELTNSLGQTVRSERLQSYENKLNIASLANGVYQIKVKSDKGGQFMQKLVVQH